VPTAVSIGVLVGGVGGIAAMVHIWVNGRLELLSELMRARTDLQIDMLRQEITMLRLELQTLQGVADKADAVLEEARRFNQDPPGIPL
jgi:hypothetical protein